MAEASAVLARGPIAKAALNIAQERMVYRKAGPPMAAVARVDCACTCWFPNLLQESAARARVGRKLERSKRWVTVAAPGAEEGETQAAARPSDRGKRSASRGGNIVVDPLEVVMFQFYDHYFDWEGLQGVIKELIHIRKRNGIRANSKVEIVAAESDLYIARIDESLVVKIGPRLEIGDLAPQLDEYSVASIGDGFIVWEKKRVRDQ